MSLFRSDVIKQKANVCVYDMQRRINILSINQVLPAEEWGSMMSSSGEARQARPAWASLDFWLNIVALYSQILSC
jgi:hypothetical protein